MLGQNVFLFLLIGSITSSQASVVRLGELQLQSQTQEISGEVWLNWGNKTIFIKNFTDESSNGVILVGTRDLGNNISEFTFNLDNNSTILNYTFNGSQKTYSINKEPYFFFKVNNNYIQNLHCSSMIICSVFLSLC